MAKCATLHSLVQWKELSHHYQVPEENSEGAVFFKDVAKTPQSKQRQL